VAWRLEVCTPYRTGFVVIYKATKILNFAHGEILMVAAYFLRFLIDTLHLHFLLPSS